MQFEYWENTEKILIDNMKDLFSIHKEHGGKVSDKWDLYLREYDRIFTPYRNKPLNLFEIGVQNGGSLEVWAKYFSSAKKIIACDINKKCASLNYSDKRISVLIGNASEEEISTQVSALTNSLDIVIDDGSHLSSEIILSFTHYFPMLAYGGVYIIEDLHCSYWQGYEGGLFNPYSSMAFLKALADTINYEHWGLDYEPSNVLKDIFDCYGGELSAESLAEIHSIEFANSLCIIRKDKATNNCLGKRQVGGDKDSKNLIECIDEDDSYIKAQNQRQSPYNNSFVSQIKSNKQELSKLNVQITQLVEENKAQKAKLDQVVNDFRNSTSWLVTAPLRWVMATFYPRRLLQGQPKVTNYQPQQLPPKQPELTEEPRTISPSFEVLSGLKNYPEGKAMQQDRSKLIAFYLPQYHRVQENSEWWGAGFTEWNNVVKGQPNYEGHYQPHLPRDLGFYDLSNIEVIREQAELAKLYGISAFCFYYYWFSGRRILEKPIEQFLHSDIDIGYCLCWANENWTRTWDGKTNDILLEQKYLESDSQKFIESLLPHFHDSRYIQVGGKPMLVVYRAKDIPNTSIVFDSWRRFVEKAGFDGLHIVVVDFYDIKHPNEVAADALVEFPPHKFNGPQSKTDALLHFYNKKFNGSIVEYAKVISQSAKRLKPKFTLYRGVLPSWDNTARRQNTPTILHGSQPSLFASWLRYVRSYTRNTFAGRDDPFIFINAWNEWGEGCHLEPDQKWGLGYLEAVLSSSWYDSSKTSIDEARDQVLAAACGHLGKQSRLPSQMNSTVQKVGYKLRGFPLVRKIGKGIYKAWLQIKRVR